MTASNTTTLEHLQRAALLKRLAQRHQPQQAPAAATIGPASRDTPLVLSHAQQRLWFMDRFERNSALYNIPLALELTGPLRVDILQRALDTIVARHEILRTTFGMDDDEPVQRIAPHMGLPLPLQDLTHQPPAQRRPAALVALQSEAAMPFDLAAGPLLRAGLLRLAPERHIAFLVLHHIVADGWSIAILMRELVTLFQALSSDKHGHYLDPATILAPLAIQYADFAAWQRRWLATGVLQDQLNYWRRQLADAPTLLTLPTDRPRPASQSFRGATHTFSIDRQVRDGLQALGLSVQASMFMVLASAFNILLARYSGQTDICIGTPIANRHHGDVQTLIGFFVNTLVLRTNLDLGQSFVGLLQQVRSTALEAYAHQDVPFDQLVEALKPQRHLSHAPLFQALLVLQNVPMGPLQLPGLKVAQVAVHAPIAKFDLSLSLSDDPDELHATFEYATDLFDHTTIERMAGHFVRLLGAIVAEPSERIGRLSLIGPAERDLMLVAWNDNTTAYPSHSTVHQQFAEQALRVPRNTALMFEGCAMTYAELDGKSSQLAHYLVQHGIGPDMLVGICVERSFEMVIGLLAILKANAAYLPLDPAYPPERLAYMIDDAHPVFLLTLESLRTILPAVQIPTLCLDSEWHALDALPHTSPQVAAEPSSMAYVIYTSGSTGNPKGVIVSHRNLLREVKDANFFTLAPNSRMLQLASITFDTAAWEIWGALLNGICLVVTAPGPFSAEQVGATILDHGVDTICLTTSVFNQMVDYQLPSLLNARYIIVGGEAISSSHVQRLMAQANHLILVNGYGPTETTVTTAYYRITDQTDFSLPVPIGRPLSNTWLYILDQECNPVPIGVAGELHIGGHGVARGYLNRPELTAERFIPNPFRDDGGGRMYKSGDLARFRPDGNIEYLGRIDDQVKIRGFRIELGEVEAALAALPEVGDAVVLARDDLSGDRRIVGYVVWKDSATKLAQTWLRDRLSTVLPDFMLPSYFVFLSRMPLTANGKTDRKALPAPDMTRDERDYIAPLGPTERVLAQVWADVLELDRVGRSDDFFVLGGHSLMASRLVAKASGAFDVQLPLRLLFEAPTVAAMAQRIDQTTARDSVPAMLLSAPADSGARDLRRLSHAQQRLWFLDQLEPGSALYNMPAALELLGPLDIAALEQALNQLLARHAVLRAIFVSDNGEPRQCIAPHLALPLPLTDLGHLDRSEAATRARALARDEALLPFDLTQGPLVRAALLRLAPCEHRLLLTVHHIVCDGWSIGVLIRELGVLYAAHQRSSSANLHALPNLPIEYADFAEWQRQWLTGDVFERQVAYWKTQLAGAPALLAFPTDRPRPPVQTFHGAGHALTIDGPTWTALQALGRQARVTPFMLLACAFQLFLWRYSGQDDICIGTPVANRERAETEHLVGLLVNTLVLRTRLASGMPFRDLLSQVRETAIAAYAYQDLPFEQVVEAVKPPRSAGYSPLFQVMFSLQQTAPAQPGLPDLTIGMLPGADTIAKFDLTLTLDAGPDSLSGMLVYNQALFDPGTVAEMAHNFCSLLQAISQAPDNPIDDLVAFSADAHEAGKAPSSMPPAILLAHRLIERQARLAPTALALVADDMRMSYAELNRHANQLAHHLRATGIMPDQRVAICLERGPAMIVAMLGIWKAGAAFVPLDPRYPPQRLRHILADSAASAIIGQSGHDALGAWLPDTDKLQVLFLDANGSADWLRSQPCHDPAAQETGLTPDHLAYVIYTSGSTGLPKGVMNHHRGLCHLAAGQIVDFAIHSHSQFLQFAAFSFDACVWEVILALGAGATLHLAERTVLLPGGPLFDTLKQRRISHVFLPPSALAALPDAPVLEALQILLIGGEALPPALARRWSKRHRVVNAYGPTETTICASTYECRPEDDRHTTPIGRPAAHNRLYILDQHLRPVPRGVIGELVIGGPQVARGYLNKPELTARHFVRDPFSPHPDARMYRSGDLARFLPDGNVEYMGRSDFQIKIRGFRIELGEIEHQLASCVGVRDAAAIVLEDKPGAQQIVAYLTAQDGACLDACSLREQLSAVLTPFMLPAAYVVLDELPLGPNGKLDRAKLPAPEHDATPAARYAPPAGALEQQLGTLWATILGVARVGRDDHFFDLGGHSLMAVRMVADLERTLDIKVALRELFAHPVLRQFALAVEAASQKRSSSLLVPLRADGDQRPLFLIHPGEGEVGYARTLADALPDSQPVYACAAQGLQPGETVLRSVPDMARRYLEELRKVAPHGPYRLGGWSFGGLVAYEMAHQLHAAGEQIEYLGLIDTYAKTHRTGIVHESLPLSETDAALLSLQSVAGNALHAQLATLAREEGINAMLRLAQAHDLVPPGLDHASLRRHLAVRHGIFEAGLAYVPPFLSLTVHLYTASLSGDAAAATSDPSLGWQEILGRQIRVTCIGGTHYSLIEPPLASVLSQAMTIAMRCASRPATGI